MPNVFFSYSHADEGLRDQLETQLAMLKRQGIIETWHDRRIGAGQDFGKAIDEHVNSDDIILLLVSPDFIASDYCYDVEMRRALERHEAETAIVIPVILRACDWHHAPFGKLLATPRDGKPVMQWPDRDEAFLQVAQAIRKAAEHCQRAKGVAGKPSPAVSQTVSSTPSAPVAIGTRSSNLRLAKTFTQRDQDRFLLETFEYIARFFENSLSEVGARNPGYEGDFRRVDAHRFFATIYYNGKDVARATVYMGSMFQKSINYAHGQTTEGNTYNESLSVKTDDQMLYLTSLGMSTFSQGSNQKLSQEGAAELLWGLLIEHLQRRG